MTALLALLAALVVAATQVEPAAAGLNQCRDKVDNDGDKLIDQLDPGCRGREDVSEADGRQTDPPPTPTATPTPTPTPTPTATPTPTPPPPPPPKPACSDGRDNDGDRKIDLADPGCARSSDTDEYNAPAPPQCSDGKDNDGDGLKDTKDPGCTSAADNDERNAAPPTQCADRIDNDGDGKIDAGQDPGCPTSADNDETDPPAAVVPPSGQAFGFSGAPAPPRPARQVISPFPIVRIAGRIFRSRVRISLFTVKAPAGATISVRCRGRGCGSSRVRLKARSSRVVRRVRRYERTLRTGAMIEIRVYKAEMIGKYTRFTVRRGRLPGRSDRCLSLNRRTPRACPES